MDNMDGTAAVETLSTRDWFDAARAVLIRDGINAVKIGRIAKECGVTRGGFYWRFKDRAELLNALLDEWRRSNTAPLIAVLQGSGTPAERFAAAAALWVEEKEFDPRFDAAVRNWALSDPDVAKIVLEVDDERIGAFTRLFIESGYEADEAFVRARIVYFHQVGYYALHLQESLETRRRLAPHYHRVLTGFPEFSEPLLTD